MWFWAALYSLFGLLFLPLTWKAKRHALFPSERRLPKSPSVSLIKPVRGINSFSETNFRSWLAQKYSEKIEFIFSFQDVNDPALPLVRSLQNEFSINIIINPVRKGFSGKTSNLYYGTQVATSEFLIFSDADTFAPQNTIVEIVHRAIPGRSLVSCLPVHHSAKGIWAHFYSHVWNSTLVGLWAPAMLKEKSPGVAGGTVGFWKPDLEAIGGVAAFANNVAEDLKMGSLFLQKGYKLELGPVIESQVGHLRFRNYWNAILRGAFVSWSAENGGKIKALLLHLFAFGYAPLLLLSPLKPTALLAPCLVMYFVKVMMLANSHYLATGKIRLPFLIIISDLFCLVALGISLYQRRLTWANVTYKVDDAGHLERLN